MAKKKTKKTLENLLTTTATKGKGKDKKEVSPDFKVTVATDRPAPTMTIQADDNEALDFTVVGNKIVPHFDNADASGMNMAEARDCLMRGERVAREGWNGKGMYLEAQFPNDKSKMTEPYVYMKTADGGLIPWMCSQADFFAGDWLIVPTK